MLTVLYFLIFSFSFAPCNDKIINPNNAHEEFMINNVVGIGYFKVPHEFIEYMKSTHQKESFLGSYIIDRFKEYARKTFNLEWRLSCVVDRPLLCNNKDINKLMEFNELPEYLERYASDRPLWQYQHNEYR